MKKYFFCRHSNLVLSTKFSGPFQLLIKLSPLEHLSNLLQAQPFLLINYLNVISSLRHSLYPRFSHPTYNTLESTQTDSSVSWFKCTHISETDSGSISSFKVGHSHPFQLQFNFLSLCIVLVSFVFSDVTTVTVEPQCVCVPFVHQHHLTQLTAQ